MIDVEEFLRDEARSIREENALGAMAGDPESFEAAADAVALLTAALEKIIDTPSDHDLMHNAVAKAVWYIATSALGEHLCPG